jgi:hypothetical protein
MPGKSVKCYHVSPIVNRESILKNGLLPKSKSEGSIQYEPRIFFSLSKMRLGLDYVDFENVDVWEFSIHRNFIKRDDFTSIKSFYYTNYRIQPENVKLIETIN